jgi:hypothetical protein
VAHLDRMRDWILMEENVQEVHNDTFFCELDEIPKLQLIKNGRRARPKRYLARYPKGKTRLI